VRSIEPKFRLSAAVAKLMPAPTNEEVFKKSQPGEPKTEVKGQHISLQ
jgi:hypothetical protein